MAEAEQTDVVGVDPDGVVRCWRMEQARRAGLTPAEAELFADGDQSLQLLRRLQNAGATAEQIARIVT